MLKLFREWLLNEMPSLNSMFDKEKSNINYIETKWRARIKLESTHPNFHIFDGKYYAYYNKENNEIKEIYIVKKNNSEHFVVKSNSGDAKAIHELIHD